MRMWIRRKIAYLRLPAPDLQPSIPYTARRSFEGFDEVHQCSAVFFHYNLFFKELQKWPD